MTNKKRERNRRIKLEVVELLAAGYSLKEALYVVADRWWLSRSMVEKIYYDTLIK